MPRILGTMRSCLQRENMNGEHMRILPVACPTRGAQRWHLLRAGPCRWSVASSVHGRCHLKILEAARSEDRATPLVPAGPCVPF